MTEPVRWNPDTEEFEYRCKDCMKKDSRIFWPLTLDFWNPTFGMTRCRACQKEFKARAERERRRDPEYRARAVAQTKEQRRLKGHIYNANRSKRSKVAWG